METKHKVMVPVLLAFGILTVFLGSRYVWPKSYSDLRNAKQAEADNNERMRELEKKIRHSPKTKQALSDSENVMLDEWRRLAPDFRTGVVNATKKVEAERAIAIWPMIGSLVALLVVLVVYLRWPQSSPGHPMSGP